MRGLGAPGLHADFGGGSQRGGNNQVSRVSDARGAYSAIRRSDIPDAISSVADIYELGRYFFPYILLADQHHCTATNNMSAWIIILCVVILILVITVALLIALLIARSRKKGATDGDEKGEVDFQKIFGGDGVYGGGWKEMFALFAGAALTTAGSSVVPPEVANNVSLTLSGGVSGLQSVSSLQAMWDSTYAAGDLNWDKHAPVHNMFEDLVGAGSEVVRANALVFTPPASLAPIQQFFEGSVMQDRPLKAGPSAENVAYAHAASLRFRLSADLATHAIRMAVRGNPAPGSGAAPLIAAFSPAELKNLAREWDARIVPNIEKIKAVSMEPLKDLVPQAAAQLAPPSTAVAIRPSAAALMEPTGIFPAIGQAGAEMGAALTTGLTVTFGPGQSEQMVAVLSSLVKNPVRAVLEITIPQGMQVFDPSSGVGALTLVGSANSRIARSSYLLSIDASASPEDRARQLKSFIDYTGRLILDGARRGEFSLANIDLRVLVSNVGALPMGSPEVLENFDQVAILNRLPQIATGLDVTALLSSLPAYSGFPVWRSPLLGSAGVRLVDLPPTALAATNNSFVTVQSAITAANLQLGNRTLPAIREQLQLMPRLGQTGKPLHSLSPQMRDIILAAVVAAAAAAGGYILYRSIAARDVAAPPVAAPPVAAPPPPVATPLTQSDMAVRAAKSGKVPLSLQDEDGAQTVIVSEEKPTGSSPTGMYMVPSAGGLAGAGAVLTLLALALSTNRPAILSAGEAAAVASASASGKSAPAWIFSVGGGRRELHTFVHPAPVATLQWFASVLAA